MIIKSQIVLYIYDELLSNRGIKTIDIVNKYGISIRTFRRYILEINSFFFNNYRNQIVEYDTLRKEYYLKNF